MHTFYVSGLSESSKDVVLDQDQSKHAIRVMRMQEGDEFIAINGAGIKAHCRIAIPNKNKCEARVLDVQLQKKSGRLVGIAIAPTKNMDRIEWFCEKATEIGIDAIYFFTSKNSERRTIKLERIDKIVVSALKQSQRFFKPSVHDLTEFDELVKNVGYTKRFIAHCEDDEKYEIQDQLQNNEDCLILIGPEGDFSIEEVEVAKSSGFLPITLGENRLRTETAGLVALMKAL